MNDACAATFGMAHWRTISASTSAGSRLARPACSTAGTCANLSTAAAQAVASSLVPCMKSSNTPFSR